MKKSIFSLICFLGMQPTYACIFESSNYEYRLKGQVKFRINNDEHGTCAVTNGKLSLTNGRVLRVDSLRIECPKHRMTWGSMNLILEDGHVNQGIEGFTGAYVSDLLTMTYTYEDQQQKHSQTNYFEWNQRCDKLSIFVDSSTVGTPNLKYTFKGDLEILK